MDVPAEQKSIFRDSTRYAVLFLTIVCFTFLFSNTMALNFTIICMGSGNEDERHTVYDYTEAQKGWLFSAVAVGNLIGTIPVTELFTHYGMRNVQSVYGIISGVATLLSPLAASHGFYCLLVELDLPQLIGPPWEWNVHCALILSSAGLLILLQFAPMFTMPASAAFCVSPIGWTGAYYLQGVLTLLFFALFYYFYRDTPRIHKDVSTKELGKIEKGKSDCARKPQKTPYLAICKNITIIGVWMSWLGGSLAFQVFIQYGPTYLNKVLHYEVSKTGMATAIPFLLSFVVKVMAGPFSDKATCVSARARIIIFTIVSQGTIAICFVVLANIPTDNFFIGWCAYTAAIVFSSLVCVGMMKCGQLVSCQFFPFVATILAVVNSISVLILPPFVSYMVPTNSPEEWSVVFYIVCIIVVVTNVFFCFVCKTDPAEWTTDVPSNNVIQVHPVNTESTKKF